MRRGVKNGGACGTRIGHPAAELVWLVVAHVAAMTLQGCVRGHLARRLLFAARQERAREWNERHRACVEAFVCSLAFGSKRPYRMRWRRGKETWSGGERYEPGKMRGLQGIGGRTLRQAESHLVRRRAVRKFRLLGQGGGMDLKATLEAAAEMRRSADQP